MNELNWMQKLVIRAATKIILNRLSGLDVETKRRIARALSNRVDIPGLSESQEFKLFGAIINWLDELLKDILADRLGSEKTKTNQE